MMRYESLDFMEAARRLAERAHLDFTFERSGAPAEPASQKDALFKLHQELRAWYQRCLRESPQAATARAYLQERSLDDRAIDMFGIGYAPHRDMKWEPWAKKRGFDMELLVKAGVLIARDQGGWYDRFADRLMFPICDDTGRVIGFSGRILPGDTRPAKYVNSPETSLFTKSKVIYALHLAKREILDRKEAVICEGQIDVIRCHLAGITNAVAAQGTAITEQHARILKRFTDTVRLVLDGDDAGQNAALRSGDTLIEAGLHVHVASLPPGDDPDSLIQRDGPEKFIQRIDTSAPFLIFKIETMMAREKNQDDAAVMRTARSALESIARLPSEVQREQWLQQAGTRLGIRPDTLAAELRALSRRAPRTSAENEPPGELVTHIQHPREELEVVRLLIQRPHGAETLREYLTPSLFRSATCRELYETLMEHAYEEHFDLMAELLVKDEESRRVAAMLQAEDKLGGTEFEAEKIAADLVIALYRRDFETRRRALEAKRRNATGDEAKNLDVELMELTLHQHTLRSGWSKARTMLDMLKSME
jgi:DNA primase